MRTFYILEFVSQVRLRGDSGQSKMCWAAVILASDESHSSVQWCQQWAFGYHKVMAMQEEAIGGLTPLNVTVEDSKLSDPVRQSTLVYLKG